MKNGRISRRDYLAMLGTGATALAASGMRLRAADAVGGVRPTGESSAEERADRERHMKWWHAAKFGMFIHWGLYSVYGHHEWAMEEEGIPVAEYEQFALKGLPGASRHPRLITSGSRRTRILSDRWPAQRPQNKSGKAATTESGSCATSS